MGYVVGRRDGGICGWGMLWVGVAGRCGWGMLWVGVGGRCGWGML